MNAMDNRYKYTPKLLVCGGIPGDLPAIAATVDTYLIKAEKDELRSASIQSPADFDALLHPFTGPTVCVDFGDETAVRRLTDVWSDSGLRPPERVETFEDGVCAVIRLQRDFVSDAAQRNVGLMGQIAALRQRLEDSNALVANLFDYIRKETGGARHALFEADAVERTLRLPPGAVARQKIPLTLPPSFIGGVSFLHRAPDDARVRVTLRAIVTDEIFARETIDPPAGSGSIFVRTAEMIDPGARLIELAIENTGAAAVELRLARLGAPEERLEVSPGDDPQLAGSLALTVWSTGPGATGATPGEPRFLRRAHDGWRAEARRVTPGFENKEDWLRQSGPNGLLLRPLWRAPAIAECPLEPIGAPVAGLQMSARLPEDAAADVMLRYIVTERPAEFADLAAAERFAAVGGEGDGALGRTDWIHLEPGARRVTQVNWDADRRPSHLYIVATANGRQAGQTRVLTLLDGLFMTTSGAI